MSDIEEFYLSQLPTFGKISAENEQKGLMNYFVQTQTYLNAKRDDTRKIYYVGHRGSGKSALFNYLMHDLRKHSSNIILSITPEEFSYGMFSKVEHQCYEMKSVYSVIWKYTLYTSIFRVVIKDVIKNKISKRIQDEIEIIKKYLTDNELLTENINTTFFDFFDKFNISRKNIKLSGVNIDGSSRRDDIALINLLNMKDMQKAISALRRLLNTYNIYIFIDELDTGWDNSDESKNFLHGLFSAVNKLKEEDGVVVYLSLRQDMYNNLPSIFNDTEKIRDEIEELYWNKDTLKALIGLRLLNFLPKHRTKDVAYTKAIDIVFENKVLEYIIDHTLHRPREVITYCNMCLDMYKKSLFGDSMNVGKIDMNILESVENSFSTHRLNEIANEYSYQYPSIVSIFLFFENNNIFYNLRELSEILYECIIELSDKFGVDFWAVKYIDSTEKLIKKLYEIGFIKIYSEHFNKYLSYYEVNFQTLKNIEKIQIHPTFHSALKLINNEKNCHN